MKVFFAGHLWTHQKCTAEKNPINATSVTLNPFWFWRFWWLLCFWWFWQSSDSEDSDDSGEYADSGQFGDYGESEDSGEFGGSVLKI